MKLFRKLPYTFMLTLVCGCMTVEQLRNQYSNRAGIKAFALSSNEIAGASWNQGTYKEAIQLAMFYCRNSGGIDCKIVDLDGKAFAAKPAGQSFREASERVYTCSSLSLGQAYKYLQEGHFYLDADNDGHPCEWKSYLYKWRPSSSYSPGANCHWVSGYRRKDGTYVKGHQRCR